jgi:hypothetical protein
MTYVTNRMIADAMNELPIQFDAHALEKRCLRRNPLEVADEIKRHHATGDPLLYYSAVFAKHVDSAFRGQIAKTVKVESENLGGESSRNQEWRKLVPVVTPAPTIPVPANGGTAAPAAVGVNDLQLG